MSFLKSLRRKSERRSNHAIRCKVTILLQKVSNISQDATHVQVGIKLIDAVQESKLASVDLATRSAAWDNEAIISARCLFDRDDGSKSLADIIAIVTVKFGRVSRCDRTLIIDF